MQQQPADNQKKDTKTGQKIERYNIILLTVLQAHVCT